MDKDQATDEVTLNETLMQDVVHQTYKDFLSANQVQDDKIHADEKFIADQLPSFKQKLIDEAAEKNYDSYDIEEWVKQLLPTVALTYFQYQYGDLDNVEKALTSFKQYSGSMAAKLNRIIEDRIHNAFRSNGYQAWGKHQQAKLAARTAWFKEQAKMAVDDYMTSYELRQHVLLDTPDVLFDRGVEGIADRLTHKIDRGIWRPEQVAAAKQDANELVDKLVDDSWDQEYVKSSLDSLGAELCQTSESQLADKIKALVNGDSIDDVDDKMIVQKAVSGAVERAKDEVLDSQDISFQFADVKQSFDMMAHNRTINLTDMLLSAYRNNVEADDLNQFAETWLQSHSDVITYQLGSSLKRLAEQVRRIYFLSVKALAQSQDQHLTEDQLIKVRKLISQKVPTDRDAVTTNVSKESMAQTILDELNSGKPAKDDSIERMRNHFYGTIQDVIHNGLVVWLSNHGLTVEDIDILSGSEPDYGEVLDTMASESDIADMFSEAYDTNPGVDELAAAKSVIEEVYDQNMANQFYDAQLAPDMIHAAQSILEDRCQDADVDPTFLGRMTIETLPWALQCIRGTITPEQLEERL